MANPTARAWMILVALLLVVGGGGYLIVRQYEPAVAKPITPERLAQGQAKAKIDSEAEAARARIRAREKTARDEVAMRFGRELGVQAEAVDDDLATLGFRLHKCDEEALLEVERTIGVDRMRAVGFKRVFCVDGADAMTQLEF